MATETAKTGEMHIHGPTNQQLLYTFIALAVLTIIEVLVGYIDPSPVITTVLILLALAKAAAVAAIFMEIAFEKEVLRIVFYVFIVPFIGILLVVLFITADWRNAIGG